MSFNVRHMVSVLCLLSITACGGGAGSSMITPGGNGTGGGTGGGSENGGVSVPTNFRLVETLPDSYSAVRFYDAKNPSAYAAIVDSQKIAKELATEGLNVSGSRQLLSNDQYRIDGKAQLSDGTDADALVHRLFLTNDQSEYAARMFVDGGANGTGYLVVGTPVSTLPKGSVTYKGFAEIVLNSPSGAAQTGNFELSLNFSGSDDVTGSLSASTNDYMMVSDQITVDRSTAELSSTTALIGEKQGVQQDAHIIGSLFGTNGQGVAAVGYSTTEGASGYIGSIVGKK